MVNEMHQGVQGVDEPFGRVMVGRRVTVMRQLHEEAPFGFVLAALFGTRGII